MRTLLAVSVAALTLLVPTAAQAQDGSIPTSGPIDYLLGLKRQEGDLARLAKAVSDPDSAHYRRYLGVREISRAFGANPVTKNSVKSYFRKHGAAAKVDASGAFATVRLSPAQARAAFGVSARSAANGKTPPPVPDELSGLVTGVTVPAALPAPEPAAALPPGIRRERTGTAKGCPEGQNANSNRGGVGSGGFTPNQIADAHGIGELHRRGIQGQGRRVALLEFDGGFNPADISTFAKCFGLPEPNIRVRGIDGRVPMPATLKNTDEVTLDIEVLVGMAPKLDAIDVYQGTEGASYAQGIAAAIEPHPKKRLPDAISISFGRCELALTDLANRSQRRLDRYMIDVAVAAGVPIFASSDDQGSSACLNQIDPELDKLPLVSYPATQQRVTAVGGTSFVLRKDNSILQQRVWNDRVLGGANAPYYAGGGGTSGLIDRPWYQKEAGLEKGKGRMVPDLAFYADTTPGWAIYCTAPACGELGWLSIGGTSAATPLFAASVALANQDAAKAGQPRLGWVNPLLYDLAKSKASPFRDVVLGDNDMFATGCCHAHEGYDRASGWGSLHIADFSRQAKAAYRRR